MTSILDGTVFEKVESVVKIRYINKRIKNAKDKLCITNLLNGVFRNIKML